MNNQRIDLDEINSKLNLAENKLRVNHFLLNLDG
jgi:hypothetical protein